MRSRYPFIHLRLYPSRIHSLFWLYQFSGTSDDTFAKVNEETEQRLVEVRQAYEKNKDLVIERLLAGITNVHPKVERELQYQSVHFRMVD